MLRTYCAYCARPRRVQMCAVWIAQYAAAGVRMGDKPQTFQPGPKSQRKGPLRNNSEMRAREGRPPIRAVPHHASIALSAGGSISRRGILEPVADRTGAGAGAWFVRLPSRKIMRFRRPFRSERRPVLELGPLSSAVNHRFDAIVGRTGVRLGARGRPRRLTLLSEPTTDD